MGEIERALEALRSGNPIMIFDGDEREAEVDLIYHASGVGPEAIYDLRVNAGGLICFATTWPIARDLGLIWGYELIRLHPPLAPLTEKTPKYGDKPAFTIWVNHVSTRTGISDVDRSKTVRELDKIVKIYLEEGPVRARRMFLEGFQAPGHVPVLAARSLSERRGHTELSTCLSLLAGLRPSVVFAEMLGKGTALPLDEAREISRRRGIPLLTGDQVVEACKRAGLYSGYRHYVQQGRHG